jgi:hypothetical protein
LKKRLLLKHYWMNKKRMIKFIVEESRRLEKEAEDNSKV